MSLARDWKLAAAEGEQAGREAVERQREAPDGDRLAGEFGAAWARGGGYADGYMQGLCDGVAALARRAIGRPPACGESTRSGQRA